MKNLNLSFFVLLFLSLSWASCTKTETLPDLAIKPDSTFMLLPSATRQFTTNIATNWRATKGTITAEGLYTAPTQAGSYNITAINRADTTKKITVRVVVSSHADLFNEMKKGGYVVFFRHAEANVGSDQPGTGADWWKTCDNTKMRQLSPNGMTQSADIGKTIKNLELPIEKIVSSEFCRASQTAQLMGLGVPIETTTDLTYYPFDGTKEQLRLPNTLKVIGVPPAKGKNILLTSHVITFDPSGLSPLTRVSQGDGAVYKVSTAGSPMFIKTIPIADWIALK